MNLYLGSYLDKVSMDIFRNPMIFNEIIKLEYQVGIIIKISPHPKYFVIEERFSELFTNNIPMV